MDYRPIAKRTRRQEDADLVNKWRKMKEEERARKENVGLKNEGSYNVGFQKGSNRDCENNGGQNSNHSMDGIKNFFESIGDDADGSGGRSSNSDSDDDLRVLEDGDDTTSHSVVQLSSDSESATGNDDHGDDGNAAVSSSHVVKQEPEIEIIEEIRLQQQQEDESSEDVDDRSTDEDADESASSSCSEDDEDFEADRISDHSTSESSSSSDNSNSEEEEKEDSDRARVRSTAVPPSWKRRGRPPGSGRGLKRTVQGLKMVMDNDNIPDPVAPSQEDHSSRRTRTRLNSSSQSSLPKEKLDAFGTYAQPLCVDEEEEEAAAAEKMGDRSTRRSYDSQKTIRRSGKNESEGRRPTKRKRLGASRNLGVHDILVNSILEKGEEVLEKMAGVSPPHATGAPLPLKFTYRAESSDDNETERSEIDQELDGLWKELEFALTSCDIGSEFETESRMIHSEDSPGPAGRSEQDGDTCSAGEHYLILDDEVGLKCKFCSHVSLEIQHVLPDFNKNPFGASEGRDYYYYRMPPGSTSGQMFADLSSETHGDIRARTYQPTETVWDIIPNIKDGMYPHQREGFEFLWRNIAGGVRLDQLRKSPSKYGNGGCIISHAPGTGKTRLAIAFLQAYMKFYQDSRPVVVAPCSMLMTWEEEFRRWNVGVPFHSLNNDDLTGREDPKALSLLRMTGRQEPRNVRLAKFYSWKNHESILGISYRLFEQLVNSGEEKGYREKKGKEEKSCAEEVWKDLLKLPGLLILDEGHTPRNDNSLIFKAFLNVVTERRIILSGTPFQNNFGELFNTLCLVRPEFVDSFLSRSLPKKRGRKRLSRSKQTFLSAVGGDENGKDRIDDLRAKIKPFVHVHKGNILQKALPGLRDSVVHLQPSPVQKNLMRKVWGLKNALKFDNQVALISVHPSLLDDDSFISKAERQRLRSNINAGVKSRFVMELIRLSLALEERVLIFSQYLPPLLFLLEQLRSRFGWNEGRELLYMDGKLELKNRQSSIASFNDPNSEAKVLLASTKACCEGISLVGASRVVLLDVVWNPSVERQAISRAYRLGQKKVVHVYHLITSGTNEEEKYERQVMKHRLSELVFRSVDKGTRQQLEISSQVCEDKILDEMVHHENLKSMFVKIYQPKADGLVESFGLDNL